MFNKMVEGNEQEMKKEREDSEFSLKESVMEVL